MRFDDLILPVGEYPAGACENKQEWLLMYSRGVSSAVIAAWCRVDVRRVHRAVERQVGLRPDWFGQCWMMHDQPAPGRNKGEYLRNREQVWWERYSEFAAYVREHGGIPAQNDSAEAKLLYRWLETQRRQHRAGRLIQDKVDALDRVGEWVGVLRGNADELWVMRLEEVRQFRAVAGRYPIYDPVRRPGEKVLAIWLGRQRTWSRKGILRADRRQCLDTVLAGWNTTTD